MSQEAPAGDVILEIKDLRTWFPIKKGFLHRVVGYVKALDGVSLSIHREESVGLVGESGCGKTTLGRTILRLVPATDGQVLYRVNDKMVDILALPREEMFHLRKCMQIVFQDPFSSLNPRMSVGDIIGEYLAIHKVPNRQKRVEELLEVVGLQREYLYRYPHECSGGQRQRIGIARTLSLKPEFIVCDEPVSALDVSVQAQIVKLLRTLQQQMGLTYLFISHDLTLVRHLCDRVAVMYVGKLVEYAPAESLFRQPRHPYSEALISSIPQYRGSGERKQTRVILQGDVPSSAHPPQGCSFHPRCRYAQEVCRLDTPPLVLIAGSQDHYAACHFTEHLNLQGASSGVSCP